MKADNQAPDGAFGTMVIRIWSEGPEESGIRARITSSQAVEEPPAVAVAGDAQQILAAVQDWIAKTTGHQILREDLGAL